MLLHRIAAGLVFLSGLGLLRLSVGIESWPLLGLGLAAAVAGLAWFVLAAPASHARPPYEVQLVRHL